MRDVTSVNCVDEAFRPGVEDVYVCVDTTVISERELTDTVKVWSDEGKDEEMREVEFVSNGTRMVGSVVGESIDDFNGNVNSVDPSRGYVSIVVVLLILKILHSRESPMTL